MNVVDKSCVDDGIQTILGKYGVPPSLLVNSAATFERQQLDKLTEKDFTDILDVNIKVCVVQVVYCHATF